MSSIATKTPAIFGEFPEVVAGITLRQGTEPARQDTNFGYQSFKQVLPVAEYAALEKTVINARQGLAGLLGSHASVHFAHQTHSDQLTPVESGDVWGSIAGDGLIGRDSGYLTGVFLADCAGVLLYEPITGLYAVVHSGWRGTRAGIVTQAIKKLCAQGAQASTIHAYISPVACPAHYEVGPEFRNFFAAKFLPTIDGRLGFDNQAAITDQLHQQGITHIEADPLCTVEDTRLHSYRRDGKLAGRFTAYIGLTN